YAAFAATSKDVVVMGDLVLLETDVSPVMARLQEQGIDISAVHNHLLRDQPKVMYLHYVGHSADAVALARSLHSALAASATPWRRPGRRRPPPPPISASTRPPWTRSWGGPARRAAGSRSTASPGPKRSPWPAATSTSPRPSAWARSSTSNPSAGAKPPSPGTSRSSAVKWRRWPRPCGTKGSKSPPSTAT